MHSIILKMEQFEVFLVLVKLSYNFSSIKNSSTILEFNLVV